MKQHENTCKKDINIKKMHITHGNNIIVFLKCILVYKYKKNMSKHKDLHMHARKYMVEMTSHIKDKRCVKRHKNLMNQVCYC